jgi:hypothetical protein
MPDLAPWEGAMAGFERTGCTLEAGAWRVDAAGLVAAGAVTAGLFIEEGPGPVDAGPAPIAFFSAALIISSLIAMEALISMPAMRLGCRTWRLTRASSNKHKQSPTLRNPHCLLQAFATPSFPLPSFLLQ